jgi:hypothetical protein
MGSRGRDADLLGALRARAILARKLRALDFSGAHRCDLNCHRLCSVGRQREIVSGPASD